MLGSGSKVRRMDRGFEGRRWSGAFGARGRAVLLACLGVALALGVVASSANSGMSFASPLNYATARAPFFVAIADLNGDGRPDLAVGAKTASVLLNRGNGTFAARRDYAGTVGAIGDLNGDGKPDLAAARAPATVSVLVNRGDGSFEPKRDYPTGSAGPPSSLAVGDLNGDGRLDVVTTNVLPSLTSTLSVLLNEGDGSFKAKGDCCPIPVPPTATAIGDLNGDGRPDLAAASEAADTVYVLTNRGDGSFRAARPYETDHGPLSVAIGDLSGDGKADLATANDNNESVSVLVNRGGGTFLPRRDYKTGGGASSLAIGDLNGDRKPEIASANDFRGTVSVLVNRGGRGFQRKLDYRAGKSPSSVAIGDLNGDGRRDVVTANKGSNTVSVLINTPGLCSVQDVQGKTLVTAKRTLARAGCRVGKVRRAYSKIFERGAVISVKPKPGTVLRKGGKVNLVVSRGRKP
jgi:hypothetical protein